MGVTIDELQIDIQSSSTNASKGIDDLAASLEKLKANGAFKSVSTNLDNLSESLKKLPNVYSASNALRTLANSIEKLKGVGTVSSLANSLKKLPEALELVGKLDIEKVAPQLKSVADAAQPLANLKSGGLNTMLSALKNLDNVTKSLDDDVIKAFADKVSILNEKLTPLSQKMTTIKAGFSAINTQARSAAKGIEKFEDGVDSAKLNMASLITILEQGVQALKGLVQKVAEYVHEASQWDGIKYQFGNAFGEQADLYYEKISKITEALNINKQAFMEHSAMSASMLIGFGVDKSDAREMGLGYTQLAYDIWAAYNNVYHSLEGADGAVAAIRSAIAGEVEPIRRAGFTIVESTLQQTAANHGLNISIEKATEAQKSYLRYLTLVDQAQSKGIVGAYAREMNTAEGMMRTFSQQLKSLSQAFGSLFLPVLVKVMPYVQAFVELLEEGIRSFAALFGIKIQDIGDTWNDYSSGVGQAVENTENVTGALDDATKAAKELKNASIGIDELNVISPQSASSAGGSGSGNGAGAGGGFSGLDINSLWDESIFDSIQTEVDDIKKKFQDWLPVLGGVSTALAGLKLTNLLKDVELAGFKLSNLGKAVSVAGITIAVGKLVWDFTGAYLEGGNENDLLKAIGTTVLGTALAGWMAGKPGAAFTLLASGVVTLSKLAVEIGEGTIEWNDTESLITMLVGGLETGIGAFFTWKTFAPIIKKAWAGIAKKAAPVLSKAGPYGWIAAAVVAGVTLALVDYDFTEVGRKLGEKLGEALSGAWKYVKLGANWVADALEIDSFWEGLYVFFSVSELMHRLSDEFVKLGDWLNEKLENLRGNVNEFFGGFFSGLFDGLGVDTTWATKFAETFDIEYFDIIESIVNPTSIGKHIITGINNGINSNAKLSALKDKVSQMWSDAKSWWDNKKGSMKTYTPSIGSIYDKVKERWDNARIWWNDKKTKMKEYTPSIGSIYEKAKARWDNAREWWNNKKAAMKTYTPSIGSIADKVKSAWNSAKTWWKNNVGGLSTKLNISVPKIKVNWDTVTAFGKSFKYPTGFKLEFAANGGIFDQGSLIWAGERGPEIMATAAGGKTGVMNVQQMQDAVYEGVYAAVTAAMRGTSNNGGAQAVNVYLDGKLVTRSVEKVQRERGASIMGNEVYAY